ncbi:MAG TPA: hypothetical protein VLW17_15305 [Thermoanaerobaculaceae bacterium]|nr:hypothetical protein [Thermoanaerobaculaceae bacterium]
MSDQLIWPRAFLDGAAWPAVRALLDRCVELQRTGSLPGTLMLVGERGAGREAAAVELAAALVCRTSGKPGCECASCQRVRRAMHPDVEFVEVAPGKTLISIEQAREIVDNLARRPYEGRRRVFVVASCHTPPLGADAASALLKTLEEPPDHVTFLLLASNPAKVLPTIVSRAVQLRVPPPSREQLVEQVRVMLDGDQVRAEAVVDAAGGDAGVAIESLGDADVAAGPGLGDVLSGAADGDPLAVLRAGRLCTGTPGGVGLAVSSLLYLAREARPTRAEALLGAAARVLAAESRAKVLNLELDAAISGGLAQGATGSSSRR